MSWLTYLSAVDGGSGKTKVYMYLVYAASPTNAVLKRKSKDLLAWPLDNVSKWNDMSTCSLLFQ